MANLILVFMFFTYFLSCGKSTDPPPPPPPPADKLTAVNGHYYKAVMGSNSTNNPVTLKLVDISGSTIANANLMVSIVEGDGTLASDSLTTSSIGEVTLSYTFDGLLGHAILRAVAPSVDTIDLYLRANTIIFEDDSLSNIGQTGYVKFDDTYGEMKKFYGEPDVIDIISNETIFVVANYEATLGIVMLILDFDLDGVINDNSEVLGAIVVDSVFPQAARYEGKTFDSIGIGSKFWRDIFLPMGSPYPSIGTAQPDSLLPYITITYDTRNVEFLCDTADTAIFQIWMMENLDSLGAISPPANLENQLYPALRRYFR